jgi:hypothetical protein
MFSNRHIILYLNEFIAFSPLPGKRKEQRDGPSALAPENVGRTESVPPKEMAATASP